MSDELPKPVPVTENEKVEAAIEEVRSTGVTVSEAAEKWGVPYTLVYNTYRGLRVGADTHADYVQKAEQQVEDLSIAGLLESTRQIVEQIEGGDMRPSELIKANQTLRDTIGKRWNWDSQGKSDSRTNNALLDILEGFRSGQLIRAPESVEVEVVNTPMPLHLLPDDGSDRESPSTGPQTPEDDHPAEEAPHEPGPTDDSGRTHE